MNTIMEYHTKAMDFVSQAVTGVERGNIDDEQRLELFSEALKWKTKSIEELDKFSVDDLTYSVMHRGAANIALECGEFDVAMHFAAKPFARSAHPDIADQLHNIMSKVNIKRAKLIIEGPIEDDELQMNLFGKALQNGRVPWEYVNSRVDASIEMIKDVIKVPTDRYPIRVAPPVVGSFAMKICLLRSSNDPVAIGDLDPIRGYIQQFMDNVEIIDGVTPKLLYQKFPDSTQRSSFLSVARKLAPDGRDVSHLGYTVTDSKRLHRTVAINTTRSRLPTLHEVEEDESPPEEGEFFGKLLFADASKGNRREIRLVNRNETHSIELPNEYSIDEIVSRYWARLVRIQGTKVGKKISMNNIDLAQPNMFENEGY